MKDQSRHGKIHTNNENANAFAEINQNIFNLWASTWNTRQ